MLNGRNSPSKDVHALLAKGNLLLELGKLSGHQVSLLLLPVNVVLKLGIILLEAGLDLIYQVPILLVHGLHQDSYLTPKPR